MEMAVIMTNLHFTDADNYNISTNASVEDIFKELSHQKNDLIIGHVLNFIDR